MKTATIEGFITFELNARVGHEFQFRQYEMTDYGEVTVMPHSFTVEISDGFDPRAKQVEALQEKARDLRVAFQLRITEIERKIGELTAIEYTAEAI